MDKQFLVEKLANSLDIFGKAEVFIRFENESQMILTIISDFFENMEILKRLKIVSDRIGKLLEIDLREYVITIIPLTVKEAQE